MTSRLTDHSTARAAAGTGTRLGPTAVAAGVMAVLLCWPMLLTTAPLGYFDTLAYVDQGGAVVESLAATDAGTNPEAGATAPTDMARNTTVARSPVYSAYAYVASRGPGGLVLSVVAQTTLTLLLVLALMAPVGLARPWTIVSLLAVGTLTTLPWMASYAMPDILAAAVIAYYMLLAGRWDDLGAGLKVACVLIAVFGTSAHYGHLPLAAGLGLLTAAILFATGMLSWARAALIAAPVVLSASASLIGSATFIDGPSLAPKRLPILLARSIGDGPAFWHLQEACPEADYAFCRAFETIPGSVSDMLWSDQGIGSLDPAQIDDIRAEEFRILWNAFLDYPAAQTWSLIGNAATQVVTVGTGEIRPLERDGDGKFMIGEAEDYHAIGIFDTITALGTAAAVLALALGYLLRAQDTLALRSLAVLVLGLGLNALIFGGLSFPVDRYQSRVVWLVAIAAITAFSAPPRTRTP